MRVKLPNGYIDGQDHFQYVDIDELRGKQQNYLADQELVVGNVGHIPKLLEDMILSLKTKEGLEWKGDKKDLIWELPMGDLETLLIKIRENTYGSRYYFVAECEVCKHQDTDLRLDLDKLEIKSLSLKELLKKKIIKLPKSKQEVEVKPLMLRDLFESLRIAKEGQDKLVTSFLALAIKRLGDKSDIKPEDLENIPVTDIKFLGEQVESIKIQGNIDTDVEITCSKCKHNYISKLNCFDASFFDPSKESTS